MLFERRRGGKDARPAVWGSRARERSRRPAVKGGRTPGRCPWEPRPRTCPKRSRRGDRLDAAHCAKQAVRRRGNQPHAAGAQTVVPDDTSESLHPSTPAQSILDVLPSYRANCGRKTMALQILFTTSSLKHATHPQRIRAPRMHHMRIMPQTRVAPGRSTRPLSRFMVPHCPPEASLRNRLLTYPLGVWGFLQELFSRWRMGFPPAVAVTLHSPRLPAGRQAGSHVYPPAVRRAPRSFLAPDPRPLICCALPAHHPRAEFALLGAARGILELLRLLRFLRTIFAHPPYRPLACYRAALAGQLANPPQAGCTPAPRAVAAPPPLPPQGCPTAHRTPLDISRGGLTWRGLSSSE